MATYFFEHIESQTISSGYTTIVIDNHQAEIANDDTEAILLAEKLGGTLPTKTTPKRKEIEPLKEGE